MVNLNRINWDSYTLDKFSFCFAFFNGMYPVLGMYPVKEILNMLGSKDLGKAIPA